MSERKITDQLGRVVTIKKLPSRIVSLVPSQTELLYDLGLDESIVGITKFCCHPTNWKFKKTKIGGTKAGHPLRGLKDPGQASAFSAFSK